MSSGKSPSTSDLTDPQTEPIPNDASRVDSATQHSSHLIPDPLTALPRYRLESPSRTSPPLLSSSSNIDSGDSDSSSDSNHLQSTLPQAAVTTFVPQSLDAGEEAEDEDDTFEFNLRDEDDSYDVVDANRNGTAATADDDEDAADGDITIQTGDVIQVSQSTSSNTIGAPASHQQRATSTYSQSTTPSLPSLSPFLGSISHPSWPTLNLPPSAQKLQRQRRDILLRLLKTWEGREQILQLTHSLVLILHSSLHFRAPRTYSEAILRPGGAILSSTIPKSIRKQGLHSIYTAAEGLDNFRRVVLIARWISNATEAVLDRLNHRQQKRRIKSEKAQQELEMKMIGEEPIEKPSDQVEIDRFSWLQPQSLAPLDVDAEDTLQERQHEQKTSGDEGVTAIKNPVSKLGKLTGKGDASGAVGANTAENASSVPPASSARSERSGSDRSHKSGGSISWTQWGTPHVSIVTETLATLGELCEVSAFLAGGGMFWRAVGFQKFGIPFLSTRRRRGVERLGIVFSLCSVLLSLVVLRMERQRIRAELRSAHRRIIRANDKIGWASELSGKTIRTDQAISSHQRRIADQSKIATNQKTAATSTSSSSAPALAPEQPASSDLQALGMDIQKTIEDLDDQDEDSDEDSDRNSSDSHLVGDNFDDSALLYSPPPPPRGSSSTRSYFPEYGHDQHHHDHHHHHRHGEVHAVSVTPILRSSERSLLRAESDLKEVRRKKRINFWESLANVSESIFLAYETVYPTREKEGVEGWTTAFASLVRISNLWSTLKWTSFASSTSRTAPNKRSTSTVRKPHPHSTHSSSGH